MAAASIIEFFEPQANWNIIIMIDHFDLVDSVYDRVNGPPDTARLQRLLKLPTSGWWLDGGGGTGRVTSNLNGLADRIVISDVSHRMLKKSLQKKVSPVRAQVEKVNPFQKYPIPLLILFLFLNIYITACVSGHHKPFDEHLAPQRDIFIYEKRLQAAVLSSRHLSMETIGQVEYPGFQAPVWQISFRPEETALYKVYINAAIHGNEPAGAECAIRMVEQLSNRPQLSANTAIDIIPIVNPWGWTHGVRFNRDGIDINRDFATFRSQESRIIRRTLQAKTYHVMLDLHEDPSADGFYLYQYGLADKVAGEKIVASVADQGYPIEQNVNIAILKSHNGIIDAPMLGLRYLRLTGQLSIANYYRLNNSKYVFTVETPLGFMWEDRLKMQRMAVDGLIDYYTICFFLKNIMLP